MSIKDLIDKNLTQFSRRDVLGLDEILFALYENLKNGGMNEMDLHNYIRGTVSNNYNILLKYLDFNRFILEVEHIKSWEDEKDLEKKYYKILSKGKVTCEQGGLFLLWGKQKSQYSSKWISIISAIIAVCALIANILFSYFKEC